MMKKQDLRVIKTEKAICEAFLQLRKNTPLEKIKVRDICRIALINTTTFYNHYADVPTLSDSLENKILEESFQNFDGKDCLFSDPERFLKGAQLSIEEANETLSILFQDRKDVQFLKLSKQLRDYYHGLSSSEEDDIRMTFLITGTMHTMQLLMQEGNYTAEELVKHISNYIHAVIANERHE